MGDELHDEKLMTEVTRKHADKEDRDQRTPAGTHGMADGAEGAPSGGVGQSDDGGRQAPASGMAQQHTNEGSD